jgi:hypothetical protein
VFIFIKGLLNSLFCCSNCNHGFRFVGCVADSLIVAFGLSAFTGVKFCATPVHVTGICGTCGIPATEPAQTLFCSPLAMMMYVENKY